MSRRSPLRLVAAPPLPNVAGPAALIGDPARAAMLMHLMDAGASSAGELAAIGGVSPQSASAHLARMVDGGLLVVRRVGRSREYALAGSAVAAVIEALAVLRAGSTAPHVHGGARMRALCAARHCYDHLAGRLGVALMDVLIASRCLAIDDGGAPRALTAAGVKWLERHLGIDGDDLASRRRPLLRACTDWTERRPHLAGALGAALLAHFRGAGWLVPGAFPRALTVTVEGTRALRALGIDASSLDSAIAARLRFA